jgi:hypothetical protein
MKSRLINFFGDKSEKMLVIVCVMQAVKVPSL